MFSVESSYHKDSNTSRSLNKVKPCSVGLVLGWVTKYEHPCCNKLFFFLFFPIPFQGDIKACRAPALCNVVSSTCIYHQFVSHFALSVFTRIYLQYHWRNVDFEYSSRDHLGILGFVASPTQYNK